MEGGWLLLLGFFGHVKKAPGLLAKQDLEVGGCGGFLRSLPNGEQHIGYEQVPVPDLLVCESSGYQFEGLIEPLEEFVGLGVVD